MAQRLAARFLDQGRYVVAPPVSAKSLASVMPAAAQAGDVAGYIDEAGFAGLAVQAVGYEHGAKKPKIHIYITKGRPRAARELASTGVEVEVNRVGKIVVHPETAAGATASGNVFLRNSRIACGSSCAPATEKYAGTAGALVRRKGSATLYVLSNNHVLAAGNHTPVDMPILSPSTLDARAGMRAPSEICRHSDICELRSGEPALVAPVKEDIAIGRVVNPAGVSSWQGDDADGYDTPAKMAAPAAGMRVKKFGRTTGLTRGIVQALINSPQPLSYKFTRFTAVVWFMDTWTVEAIPSEELGSVFALPGDSGSLVVTEKGDVAVGVVFAASPNGEYGFIIPMNHVATLCGGLSLVSGHGV